MSAEVAKMTCPVCPKFSKGNTKIGNNPNLSLPPRQTCDTTVGCFNKCYAMKSWRMYEATRAAWTSNLEVYTADPEGFFAGVAIELLKTLPKYFRWHVSGDCPDAGYCEGVVDVARQTPSTKHLIFTKRYLWWSDLITKLGGKGRLPGNLSVVFSGWPGTAVYNPHTMPIAWLKDKAGVEHRIPTDAFECPGSCEGCMACWHLYITEQDVWFHEH